MKNIERTLAELFDNVCNLVDEFSDVVNCDKQPNCSNCAVRFECMKLVDVLESTCKARDLAREYVRYTNVKNRL